MNTLPQPTPGDKLIILDGYWTATARLDIHRPSDPESAFFFDLGMLIGSVLPPEILADYQYLEFARITELSA